MSRPRRSMPWRGRRSSWDSRTQPPGRWCARATTQTSRPRRPASRDIDPSHDAITTETAMDKDPTPTPFYKSLYFQVITAIVVGVLLGHFWPETGAAMKPLGDGFIKL